MTRMSRLSLSAFSSSSDFAAGMMNASDVPSGAHFSEEIDAFSDVICSASPPDTRMTNTFALSPPRGDRNAIDCPSGDH
jgi:hypothetical protein